MLLIVWITASAGFILGFIACPLLANARMGNDGGKEV